MKYPLSTLAFLLALSGGPALAADTPPATPAVVSAAKPATVPPAAPKAESTAAPAASAPAQPAVAEPAPAQSPTAPAAESAQAPAAAESAQPAVVPQPQAPTPPTSAAEPSKAVVKPATKPAAEPTKAPAATASASKGGPDPIAQIREHDRELQAMLRRVGKNPTKAQQDTLKTLINGMFDFGELGKRSLGAQWDKITKAQQDSFVTVFRQVVENSSVKRLESYRSDSAIFQPPTGDSPNKVVKGVVWSKGKSTQVVYHLRLVGNRWKAWDLVLDDLSTMRNYRDQFSKIVAKDKFEGLMKVLRKKASAG